MIGQGFAEDDKQEEKSELRNAAHDSSFSSNSIRVSSHMEPTKEPVAAMMYVGVASRKPTMPDLLAVDKPVTCSSLLTEGPLTNNHSLIAEETWNRCVKVGIAMNKMIAVPVYWTVPYRNNTTTASKLNSRKWKGLLKE